MQFFFSVILLSSFLLVNCTLYVNPVPCNAHYLLQHDEVWYFNTSLIGQTVGETRGFLGINGIYQLSLAFCQNLNLTEPGGLGWFYGSLQSFEWLAPFSVPDRPVLTFTQYYGIGDDGSPCNLGRTAVVNIWCGNASTDCSTIPGSISGPCLSGSLQSGVCYCSSVYNATDGICGGITINLLSHNCPNSTYVLTPRPGPPGPTHNVAGVVVGTLVAVFFFLFFIGFMYNYLVHHKTGCSAVPFYDTCAGGSATRSYDSIHPNLN